MTQTIKARPAGQTVRFGDGLEGVLFLPESTAATGAVIILHERYGLVQHTLDLAQRLASDGYVALAPDLFSRWQGDRDALRRGDVRVILPDDEVASVVEGGLAFLRGHDRVAAARIALMGVCQSGRYPPVVGARGTDFAATVILYGAAQDRDWEVNDKQPRPMEEMLAATNTPFLVIFGEADHTISLDDVLRVRGALEGSRKNYRMKVFPRAPHGWLNDTMPGRYRPEMAEEAWQMLLVYLSDVFEGRWPGPGRVRWEFESDIGTDYDFSKNVRLA